MDIVKKFTLRSVFISLCLVVLGIIIIINANDVLFWLIKVIGIVLLIDAIIRFISFLRLSQEERSFNFDLIRAVVEAVLGIVALVNSSSVVTLLYIFIGVIIIVEGILHTQFIITHRLDLNHWIINFLIAIINILCGIFVVAHPIFTSGIVNIIIGIEIILSSVLGICSYIYLYVFLKKVSKEIIEIDDFSELN